MIKLQDFHKFWSKLEKSEHEKGVSPETDIVKWTFKDGTVLDVKQEEHSVGDPATLFNTDSPLHPTLNISIQISITLQAHHRPSDPAHKLTITFPNRL